MDEIVKLNCPNCGGKLNLNIFSNSVTCVYCGQSSLITGATGLINSQSRCPLCGDKDAVRKVSVMMLSQDPIVEHLRPPLKPKIPSLEEYLLSKRENQSDSTASIEKPPKKNMLLFIGLAAFLVILIFNIGFNNWNEALISVLLILAVGIMGYLAYRAWIYNNSVYKILESDYIKKIQKASDEKKHKMELLRGEYEKMAEDSWKKFELALKRWDYLYYCSRDGILFVPGGDRFTKVGEMMKYLYSDDM